MLILSGNNLGERQKELNLKVNEAALSNVDFQEIKNKSEQSDVDKLFKIDLASKYKNINYVIEVLKSRDTLHISRALKCIWMFDDEFSHIINVDYLHLNIFPSMSPKMKRKLLTTISLNIRNVERAEAFYSYCIDTKLRNIALNFVLFTSKVHKLDFLKKEESMMTDIRVKKNLKHFVGSSFTIADAYLTTQSDLSFKLEVLEEVRHLYSVSCIKYLDMLEDHVSPCNLRYSGRLGLRISKDILTKHKDRVFKYPDLYINILNQKLIVKYTTPEHAKLYAKALLSDVNGFWQYDFCGSYEYILNILPAEERFVFIKKIFCDKYPNQEFEMCRRFYELQYFRFMTIDQKETWALDQIASKNEILGTENDYKWYRFVKFEKAFEPIKKFIMITCDQDKRNTMTKILIESARNHNDLEKLFKYYYDRHNNELQYFRESFMDDVALKHNIFEFDKNCWEAYNKICQNLNVYSMTNPNSRTDDLKIIALIYNIINKNDVHNAIKLYITDNMCFYTLKQNSGKLSKERQSMVYDYLFNFYLGEIKEFCGRVIENKNKFQRQINNLLNVLLNYGKTKEDIPEMVMKLIQSEWAMFESHSLFDTPEEPSKQTTQEDIIRYLKQDVELVVENLPLVKEKIADRLFHLGRFLNKIKVYFSNDIAKVYLKFYNDLLTDSELTPNVALAACYGIFLLAEDSFKVDFMTKYTPTESKINRCDMEERLLNIQEAICATALHSRPPVPFENMLMYAKGDYTPSCLPMINFYLANLPPSCCYEFIKAILNKPLSIQKHGVRLAFVRFNAEDLAECVFPIWKKTKNISLRQIIYKALYSKILDENQQTQTALFDTLRKLTLELHEEDDNEVFELLTCGRLPNRFISDYVEAAWIAVSALPINSLNLARQADVIEYMKTNIRSIRQEIIRPIVEAFVKEVYDTEESVEDSLDPTGLTKAKWDLTTNYIMYVQNKEELKIKLDLTVFILNQCFSRFNLVVRYKYVMRKFMNEFIRNILSQSFLHNFDSYEHQNIIFETIIQMLHDSSSIEDFYMILWAIRMNIAARKALNEIKHDDSETVRSGILNFGRDIGKIIMEFIEKEMYFECFSSDIQNTFTRVTRTMADYIEHCHHSIKNDDVLVIASVALMEFKVNKIYLFALQILPPYHCRQYDYNYILNKMKELNNIEIKCKMYDKFIHYDFVQLEILPL